MGINLSTFDSEKSWYCSDFDSELYHIQKAMEILFRFKGKDENSFVPFISSNFSYASSIDIYSSIASLSKSHPQLSPVDQIFEHQLKYAGILAATVTFSRICCFRVASSLYDQK